MMLQVKIRFKYSCCFAFSASLKCDKMVVSVLDHELEIIRAKRKSLFFLRVEYKVKDETIRKSVQKKSSEEEAEE